jgi:hypothetical protein
MRFRTLGAIGHFVFAICNSETCLSCLSIFNFQTLPAIFMSFFGLLLNMRTHEIKDVCLVITTNSWKGAFFSEFDMLQEASKF